MSKYIDKIRSLTESELKENGRFMLQQKHLNNTNVSKITIIEPFDIDDNNTISYKGKCVVTVSDEIGSQIMSCTFEGIASLVDDAVSLSPSPITLKKR